MVLQKSEENNEWCNILAQLKTYLKYKTTSQMHSSPQIIRAQSISKHIMSHTNRHIFPDTGELCWKFGKYS